MKTFGQITARGLIPALMFTLLIGLLATGSAWAQDDDYRPRRGDRFAWTSEEDGPGFQGRRGPRGPGGPAQGEMFIVNVLTRPEVAEKLGLSEEQITALSELEEETREEEIEFHEQLRTLHQDLRDLLEADQPNRSEIMKQIEALGEVRTEHQKFEVDRRLNVREILTDEQEEMVRTFIEHRRDHRRPGASRWDKNEDNERPFRGQRDGQGLRGRAPGGQF